MGKDANPYLNTALALLTLLGALAMPNCFAAEDKPIIAFGERAWGQRPEPKIQQWAVYPAEGQQFMIYHADIVEPPSAFEVGLFWSLKALSKG
jgi:hypothetical protein